MKWVLINNQRSALKEYQLIDNGECRAVIKYNPLLRSARMYSNGQQRLFYIESTGSLTGKYVLKNEYGMETGSMSQDKWLGKDGTIIIESTKYAYRLSRDTQFTEIKVFNGITQKLLASCEFPDQANDQNNLSSPGYGFNYNCLLPALCWHILLTITTAAVEHAA